MERSLLGNLIAGLGFLPWVVEIAYQVRLQARFLEALPPEKRAALPRHPRRPVLAFLGSTRFQLAVWRSFRRDAPDDPAPVLELKARMRASLRREILWALGGIAILVYLLHGGWRPWA
ncbi:MAG TPA: hypothetical protein VHK47_24105 [Polyangia bacterium]|jgi:hypothetical protein|nr:hypothetical protein [Polyangia bacterium]